MSICIHGKYACQKIRLNSTVSSVDKHFYKSIQTFELFNDLPTVPIFTIVDDDRQFTQQ